MLNKAESVRVTLLTFASYDASLPVNDSVNLLVLGRKQMPYDLKVRIQRGDEKA